jgi:hypothetical protein
VCIIDCWVFNYFYLPSPLKVLKVFVLVFGKNEILEEKEFRPSIGIFFGVFFLLIFLCIFLTVESLLRIMSQNIFAILEMK